QTASTARWQRGTSVLGIGVNVVALEPRLSEQGGPISMPGTWVEPDALPRENGAVSGHRSPCVSAHSAAKSPPLGRLT
ncbi:MAG: hypothetical protein AAFW98_15965, partial [Pseudomonadota bacterium]